MTNTDRRQHDDVSVSWYEPDGARRNVWTRTSSKTTLL